MEKDNDKSFSFSVDLQHDIVQSMGQQIDDLSLSLSRISIKNQQLEKQISHQEVKKCPNNHPLRYMYTKKTINFSYTNCDECGQKVDKKSNIFWNCSRCDYDQCRKCGGYKRTVCVYGHTLQFIQKYPKTSFRCDICHSASLKSGWHCQCDFDVCENCYYSA